MKLLLILFWFLSTLMLHAQTITGVVSDENGHPIANVNVIVENAENGTTTAKDGSYILTGLKTQSARIVVSHVGFITQTKTVGLFNEQTVNVNFVLKFDIVHISEIVISAGGTKAPEIVAMPARTVTLEAGDIMKIPAISAGSMFSHISGVNVSSEAGIFSSSSVSIRGIGGNSQTGTLIVLDGMPLNKSDGGSVNWNIIDKDNIGFVEVIKGSGSALFGSNAMGGVINIITKQPDETFNGTVSLSYGTYNTPEGKLNLSGISTNSRWFWKTFAHHRKSDGYINTPDEIIAENDTIVVPVFIEEFFAGAMIGCNINERNSLEFSFNYFDDVRGRGTKIFEEIGSATHRDTYQAFIKYKGNLKKWNTYANLYGLRENFFRLNEFYSDGEYKLYEVDSKRDDLGLRLWGKLIKKQENEIIAGGEIRLGSVDAKDIYYTSTDLISNAGMMDIAALFIQSTHKLKDQKWTIVAGIRYDYARFHDAAFSIEKPSYSIEYFSDFQFDDIPNQSWGALNPKFTLQHKPSEKLKWYVSASKGFRAPVLDNMCRSERSRRGLRIANPELKAEHIYTIESGIDKLWQKKILTQVSVFYTKGYDFMHLLSTGDSVNLGYTVAPIFKISNISAVNFAGLEFDANYLINKDIRLFANYSYLNAKIEKFIPNSEADTDLNGKFLTNIPMHTASAGIVFMSKILNLSISAKHTGKRWISDDNEVDNIYLMSDQYSAYTVLDAKLWKKFGKIETSFDVNNVFNVIYINSRGYKSPGRMLFLKLTYQISVIKK
jgi:iron complex outermembrane recepter protein